MDTRRLAEEPDEFAPDGAEVRFLARTATASMAEFRLPPGLTAHAVRHRTVDEVWFVVSGQGELWRQQGDHSTTVALLPGTSISIEVGTSFQFRNVADAPLSVVGTTMPPWPGDDEAELITGAWEPTARSDQRR